MEQPRKLRAQKRRQVKKDVKKEVAKEVKKELNKEVRKEERAVTKMVQRAPRRPGAPPAYTRSVNGMDETLNPAKGSLTEYVKTKNVPQQVLDLFTTVVAPGTGKAVRIGDEFGSRPTGVCSLYEKTDTAFPSGSLYVDGKYSGQCFLFRSALRFQMFAVPPNIYNPFPVPIQYNTAYPMKISASGAESFFSLPLDGDPERIGLFGERIYPGKLGASDPHYGYIANATDTHRFENLGGAPGENYLVTQYRFERMAWIPITTGTLSGVAALNFAIERFGYYAYGFRAPSPVAGASFNPSIAMTFILDIPAVLQTTRWVQRALPDLDRNIDTIENVKFHGLSLMWTNTTPVLNKGGQIAMMQVPANTWFGDFVGYQNVSTRNTKVNANITATEGAYLFLKPSRIADFDFQNEFVPVQTSGPGSITDGQIGQLHDAWFHILPPSDYITISLDLSELTNPTGYWTARTDIEYASVDQWRNLVPPTINTAVIEQAMPLIAAAPQFHTNDFHLSDLWEWVKGAAKKVASAIVDYGPAVVKAAAMVAPLLL